MRGFFFQFKLELFYLRLCFEHSSQRKTKTLFKKTVKMPGKFFVQWIESHSPTIELGNYLSSIEPVKTQKN